MASIMALGRAHHEHYDLLLLAMEEVGGAVGFRYLAGGGVGVVIAALGLEVGWWCQSSSRVQGTGLEVGWWWSQQL